MARTPWPAEALWEQLLPRLPGLTVEVVASCPSTNTLLLERARAGDLAPALLVAERQTQGRGRLGRPWQSAEGTSLTFSLALPYAPRQWSGLSLAVGVALAEAIDPTGTQVALKWPNDLWLRDDDALAGGRKLAGVLIETVGQDGQRVLVVGCGINVLPMTDKAAAEGLASGYACLQEMHATSSAQTALSAVAGPLVDGLQRFSDEGFAAFVERFAARDLLRGRDVTTTSPGLPEGRVEGVDGDGALLVREPPAGGPLHRLTSGEVSVRPKSPAGLARAGAC